jgi:hypothetical protein
MSEQPASINASDAIRHGKGGRIGSRNRRRNAEGTLVRHILEPLELLGLDQFGLSAVIVKTRPSKQWLSDASVPTDLPDVAGE